MTLFDRINYALIIISVVAASGSIWAMTGDRAKLLGRWQWPCAAACTISLNCAVGLTIIASLKAFMGWAFTKHPDQTSTMAIFFALFATIGVPAIMCLTWPRKEIGV